MRGIEFFTYMDSDGKEKMLAAYANERGEEITCRLPENAGSIDEMMILLLGCEKFLQAFAKEEYSEAGFYAVHQNTNQAECVTWRKFQQLAEKAEVYFI